MSQDEPSANAYLEALATGLPVVAHDWEVVRWTMDGVGNLVDTSDFAAVSRALQDALSRRTPADIASRTAMIRRRFAWSSIAGDYCRFFDQIARC
jgi:glycosyltransferase involved in cell wall biosynthesis